MPSLDAELYAEAKNPTDGGGLPQLAPDLTFPASVTGGRSTRFISGINAFNALTTAVSFSGKHLVSYLVFTGLTAETVTIKLTIDGVVIWNSTFTSPTTLQLLGDGNPSYTEPFESKESFLLEIQTTSDTNVNLEYLARPIL